MLTMLRKSMLCKEALKLNTKTTVSIKRTFAAHTVAALTVVAAAISTPHADAKVEDGLPPSIPSSFRQLARHIDIAQAKAAGDFSDCTVFSIISRDLAYVAIGHVNDSNPAAVAQFKSVSLSISRAQGACLMQERVEDAQKIASKMLDLAGQNLLLLTKAIGY